MNLVFENILLVATGLGFLLSVALLTSIFRTQKANFFLGLATLIISLELLMSCNSQTRVIEFPFWIFLTYYILPPSVWLFTKYTFDLKFKLKRVHWLLFFPALLEILIHASFSFVFTDYRVNLMEYWAWIWFIDYIPLTGFLFSLGYFWKRYLKAQRLNKIKKVKDVWVPHLKLMSFLIVFSLIGLLWLLFMFIGWEHFWIIELLFVLLLLVISFLIFIDNQSIPFSRLFQSNNRFDLYDDVQQLKRLNKHLLEKQLYVNPSLSMRELSREMDLPTGYLSYLINQYHHKNFKRFINDYRIEAFLRKASLPEEKKCKTLLALALESGFSSKSTFNQVFKNHMGQSPSEYLK